MAVEILALRQQVAVLKRRRPKPPLHPLDRLFWTVLRAIWSRWKDALFIVKPETVVGWHRAGFRLYWRWKSRPRGGRPRITEEVRVLIRRLGTRELRLGRAEDPRRVAEARLHAFRKDRRTLFAAHPAPGRPAQEVACVS